MRAWMFVLSLICHEGIYITALQAASFFLLSKIETERESMDFSLSAPSLNTDRRTQHGSLFLSRPYVYHVMTVPPSALYDIYRRLALRVSSYPLNFWLQSLLSSQNTQPHNHVLFSLFWSSKSYQDLGMLLLQPFMRAWMLICPRLIMLNIVARRCKHLLILSICGFRLFDLLKWLEQTHMSFFLSSGL